MILLKKQTTKMLMRLRECACWSGPLLLQITRLVFSVAVELLYVSFNHGTYNTPIPHRPRNPLIDKYLDSWLIRTQFVMVLTDSHRP